MGKIIKPKNVFERFATTIILSLLLVFILWVLLVESLYILTTIGIGIMTIYGFYSYFRKLFKSK